MATVADKECVEFTRECVRLAVLPANQAVKDQLLKIACRWMETATHERLACAISDPRQVAGDMSQDSRCLFRVVISYQFKEISRKSHH